MNSEVINIIFLGLLNHWLFMAVVFFAVWIVKKVIFD